jgi:hypothetical protein
MAFTPRLHRRLPVSCPVAYHIGLAEGYGTLLDLSLSGFRFSGNLPLRVGETCALIINLPQAPSTFVSAGIVMVKWKCADEYGVETVVAESTSKDQLVQYMRLQVQQHLEPVTTEKSRRRGSDPAHGS